MFSISISCPALNLKGTWVLQLAGQAADLVKQCLSQFLDVLRGSGMVTVEKQGDLSVGQVLNIDKLLYKRLQEWEEKLKACDKIKHEKETWQRRVNDMRIEYIREIEMFRLKLRRLQKNESVSDLRDSSMKKSRNAASQTDVLELHQILFREPGTSAVFKNLLPFQAKTKATEPDHPIVKKDQLQREGDSLERAGSHCDAGAEGPDQLASCSSRLTLVRTRTLCQDLQSRLTKLWNPFPKSYRHRTQRVT